MSTIKKADETKPYEPSIRVGPTTELSVFFKVKPGTSLEALQDGIRKYRQVVLNNFETLMKIGLHETRLVIFDDGTRILFATSFDGDWTQYIDDAVMHLAVGFQAWLIYLEGYPATKESDPIPDKVVVREYIKKHQVPAVAYARTAPGGLKEVQKGLRLNNAFQKVLDDPASHKALQDPALKPLLDMAAD